MSVSLAPVGVETEISTEELRAFVARELAAWAGQEGWLALAVPAPAVVPETLLRVADPQMAVLWDPPGGPSFAGVGVAHRIDLAGPDRFSWLQQQADLWWPRLMVRSHPACSAPLPRLYGGLAFAPGAAAQEPWQEFGDGCFTCPRLGYSRTEETATLSLTVQGHELLEPDAVSHWSAQLLTVREQLARPPADRRWSAGGGETAQRRPGLHLERPPFAQWQAQVEAIRAWIAAGHCEKIVAARRSVVELAAPVTVPAVLDQLARGLRASTRFAFCRAHSAFLGAAPERLIALAGQHLVTEALAGSIAVGAEHEAQLLASGKDLREHQLVIDSIVRRLAPLCAHLEVAAQPRIRELREVLHLHTPISGELRQPHHVLDLAAALHPTPAVGGVPTAEALAWIARAEPAPRGWYASPIGWFDAHGNGEFAVALRACVLTQRRAYLYAGAGIVRDSDPAREDTETRLKETVLLTALELAQG